MVSDKRQHGSLHLSQRCFVFPLISYDLHVHYVLMPFNYGNLVQGILLPQVRTNCTNFDFDLTA